MAGKEQRTNHPPKELPKPSRKAIALAFAASGLLFTGGIFVSQSDISILPKETVIDKQTNSPEKSDPKPTPQSTDLKQPLPRPVETTVFTPPVSTPESFGRFFTIVATAIVGFFFCKRRSIMIQ